MSAPDTISTGSASAMTQRWYAVRYRSNAMPHGVIYGYGPRHVATIRKAVLESGWDVVCIEPCTREEATR